VPTKGDRTRQRILEQAASLFNDRGYHAVTVGDLMTSTGLQKGGIYNHFDSREDLVLAAYDHNADVLRSMLAEALDGRRHAAARLHAIVGVFRDFANDPPYPGGCPTLNTSVQSRGVDPRLHAKAQSVLHELLDELFGRVVARGVERGELVAGTDPAAVASVFVASIEGALLLKEMLADPTHMDRVAAHLDDYIDSLTSQETPE
jgi:TetR/AcrR family transcriptional regulator, transcriptional repressor for nem operon